MNNKIQRFIVFDDSKRYNILIVTTDDNVYGFGSNFYGGLGFGHKEQIKESTKVDDLCKKNIRQFIPGGTFILAVDDNNQIYAWGRNQTGQIGLSYVSPLYEITTVGKVLKKHFNDKALKQVSCGSTFALALTSDGQVFGWGDNSMGQLGCGDRDSEKAIAAPTLITTLLEFDIKSINCCCDQSFALTTDGQVLSWGYNSYCQLGHDLARDEIVYNPIIINISNVKTVCPALRKTYFLTNDGLLYFCGVFANEKETEEYFQTRPKQMDTESTIDSIKSCVDNQNNFVFCGAMSDNKLFYLKYNYIKRTKYYTYFDFFANEAQMTSETIDFDDCDPHLTSLSVDRLIAAHITEMAHGKSKELTAANREGEDLDEKQNIYELFPVFNKIEAIVVQKIKLFHIFDDWNGSNVLFVRSDDMVYGFGSNNFGCLGLGHDRAVEEPELIIELFKKNIRQFYNGLHFCLALNDKNQLLGWGWNQIAQLGRGFPSHSSISLKPEIIPFDFKSKIIEISCGASHTLLLTAEGSVFEWGYKLQQNSTDDPLSKMILKPSKMLALEGHAIKSVVCDVGRSFALAQEGLVFSWGTNQYCTLGHDIPVGAVVFEPQLIDISNINSVVVSSNNTYFLTNDKTLYFCGVYENSEKSGSFQSVPIPLETDLKFDSIHYLIPFRKQLTISTALSENTIYFIDYNKIEKTNHRNYLSYYAFEEQMTYKTINVKDSQLDLQKKQDQDLTLNKDEEILSKEFITKAINQFFPDPSSLSTHNGEDIPSTLGQLKVLRQLDKGGFGTVYEVQNTINNELFAFKIINFKTDESGSEKRHFMREVLTLSKLRGDCIANYINSKVGDNCLYIQMELCDGNLKTIIDLKPKVFNRTDISPQFNPFEYFISSELFKELLQCIEYLHQTIPVLIHRDLKPANILVNFKSTNGKFLKVCDFGLATIQTYASMKHKSVLGTEKYQAPEVYKRKGYQGTKVDIYSTGLIAQELFDIDFNIDECDQLVNEDVKNLYKNVRAQIELMVSHNPNNRPNSCHILNTSQKWSVDRNVVKQWTDFDATLNGLKYQENPFFYNYFLAKI